MKNYEEILAEASRVEVDPDTGRVFIVFEVKSEKFKKDVLKNWTENIEYRLIGKNLVKNE